MGAEKAKTVYRRDYRPPDYWIDTVELHFDLGEEETRVRARLAVRRDAGLEGDPPPLVLDGEALSLRTVAIDGDTLPTSRYQVTDDSLVISNPPARFELETVVVIRPQENTALSGLYRSGDLFCTQCEAMGFRRITYFLDRPEVMSRYTTRIEADASRYPVLLSNGNRIADEELAGGRHRVSWQDPHPKPAYLFALVAGDLRCLSGQFTTRSGREVRLEIWVEPQNVHRCEHALRSLVKAMRWDEETFGLEYDLDIYMIVAVGDFNMGAMENKGLNIFNAKYVLAEPETATDDEYEDIEAVIGHEYFHNWTGNRVTCRDWFQLTLKEGLTVFRDQEFTADSTSRAVKRIRDAQAMRSAQFPEDAGPMSHPIRPESYISMDNFYTATVYEKGAEVVRMLHTLLGAEGFRRGMDLYFERHDGQAVTCDDFRAAMADANDVDLSQFERWYSQAGTPVLEARGAYDEAARTYGLTLRQFYRDAAADDPRAPLPIPVAVGLLGPDGHDLPLVLEGDGGTTRGTSRLLVLRDEEEHFTFRDVDTRPVPSVLRGYSAPVKLVMERDPQELAFLMGHDGDAFNRWDAGQERAMGVLLELTTEFAAGGAPALDPAFAEAFGRVLADPALDGSLKALALSLPSEKVLGQEMPVIDVDAIHAARRFAIRELARSQRSALEKIYGEYTRPEAYRADRASIDGRRLKNTALRYLASLEDAAWTGRIARQFDDADNMTDRQAALSLLVDLPGPERERALGDFYRRWEKDPLVLDKWFAVQAQSCLPDTLDRVVALSQHADFTLRNPNRIRALIGSFCSGNQVRFHDAEGRGYTFLTDLVLELDPLNPQVASRMVSAFNQWRRFDSGRRERMHAELDRIASRKGLSKDVREIAERALRDAR